MNQAPAACFYTQEKSAATRAPRPRGRPNGWPRPIRRPTQSLPSSAPAASDGNDAGYMGPSSASTFVQEANDLLVPSAAQPGDTTARPQEEVCPTRSETLKDATFDDRELETGAEVLFCIPSSGESKALLKDNASPVDSWLPSAAVHICESMWSAYGAHLEEPRLEHTVKQMARRICDQANHQLDETRGSGRSWLSSFSGTSLRWESLGILFALWAVKVAQKMNNDDDRRDLPRDGSADQNGADARFRGYVKCVESCLRLSRWQQSGNTIILYLLIKYTHLASIVHGDASLMANTALADAVSVATKLGLHVDHAPNAEPMAFFFSQIRRRLFGHLFTLDKVASVFSGRPPLLSGQYCSVSLPLDISDQILLESAGLDSVPFDHVDQNGWNTYGGLHSTTVLRARTMMAYIKEEILRLVLGVGQTIRVDHLLQLLERQLRTYGSFPACLIYETGGTDFKTLDTRAIFAQILILLEHLQNLFLIKRILVRTRTDSLDGMSLIGTCQEILCVAHDMWTKSSRIRTLRYSFGWMLVGYVCPAAGLLCGELLTAYSPLHASRSYPQKSDVVIQLSLLHSFLGFVKADSANATLCTRAEHLIHRVLQQTLNADQTDQDLRPQEHDQSMGEPQRAADGSNTFFSFELLDTFDWAADWA
ncbi:Transcription factor [Niveomyces insectorum RCEF 264]|uniref:Transcription factor n=1 Tax=Niveomyces insectorum RCEF 264 TaxID=1081102 RepID=A0A167XAG5_9HYPO|nr:Transcription factor [Niveomyces insectorum RCEF 264]